MKSSRFCSGLPANWRTWQLWQYFTSLYFEPVQKTCYKINLYVLFTPKWLAYSLLWAILQNTLMIHRWHNNLKNMIVFCTRHRDHLHTRNFFTKERGHSFSFRQRTKIICMRRTMKCRRYKLKWCKIAINSMNSMGSYCSEIIHIAFNNFTTRSCSGNMARVLVCKKWII